MIPLYFYILLGSVIIPLLFSIFCIDFIKYWKNFTLSTSIIAVVFLIWDVLFTYSEVWGFNPHYLLGIGLFQLPIEEWLFFFIIPFCSLFTHFAFFYAYPKFHINKKITFSISILLIALSFVLIISNLSKAYTCVNFSFLLITLSLGFFYNLKLLQQFYLSFIIILIPFFMVNGILTGALTETPIVWYDDLENLGVRWYTIPIEDIAYAFSMLFGNLMIFEYLNQKQFLEPVQK